MTSTSDFLAKQRGEYKVLSFGVAQETDNTLSELTVRLKAVVVTKQDLLHRLV